MGPALDHRHHRHRRGTSTRRTRRRRAPTSTTCSATSTRCCASRSTTRTSRASTPGCGRCSPGESEPTVADLPRAHRGRRRCPGLVMIAGGKLTTYRVMAQDAVDAAAHSLGRPACRPRASPTGCRCSAPTASRPAPTSGSRWPGRSGLHVARIDHLLGRYGGLVDEVLALVAARPDAGASRSTGAEDYLRAEVVYAVTHEGARHLDDVLTRRTRISIETFDRGVAAARPAAELMAGELGWDAARARRRGRPLPAPGRGRAAEPARSPPTRRPTRPGSAPPTSSDPVDPGAKSAAARGKSPSRRCTPGVPSRAARCGSGGSPRGSCTL